MTTPTWWQRNRLALLSLLLIGPLALLSASFRLINVYLPWTYHVAHTDASGTVRLAQTYRYWSELSTAIEVTARVESATQVTQIGKVRAAPVSVLWQVTLTLAADPKAMLDVCTMWLADDAWRQDGTQAGKVGDMFDPTWLPACVPKGAEGPRYDIVQEQVVQSDAPRPPTWTAVALVAVPEGVTPTHVILAYQEPDYIDLRIN